MSLFSRLFGSEESRNEARLRKAEIEREKELAALEPQINADRERMIKAARWIPQRFQSCAPSVLICSNDRREG